ncbi:MAG TPA: YraN family protein [Gemmatimonadaceae bacterium]|nr:YraN family protein [Gemmatimonadaceae bacterium]
MSAARQSLGVVGERVAERWLGRLGWQVLERRFRSGRRDIDLVARQDATVVFVEVKARRSPRFGGPVEAVGWRKRRELSRSARVWIDRNGVAGDAYRFDVIGVLIEAGRVRVRHVRDAFAVAP